MRMDINPNTPSIAQGDSARVQQVISNVITNAIKYTERGRIVIRSQRANNTQWLIRVEDTGIGISETDQGHIFDSFRQVDESSGWEFGGVGLGLAIVHNLVTAMDGHVTVKSKIGHGSTFTVFLPIEMVEVEHIDEQ